jgi:hypothetical protein
MGVEWGPVTVDERGAELLFGDLAASCIWVLVGLIGEGSFGRYRGCKAGSCIALGRDITIFVYGPE